MAGFVPSIEHRKANLETLPLGNFINNKSSVAFLRNEVFIKDLRHCLVQGERGLRVTDKPENVVDEDKKSVSFRLRIIYAPVTTGVTDSLIKASQKLFDSTLKAQLRIGLQLVKAEFRTLAAKGLPGECRTIALKVCTAPDGIAQMVDAIENGV